MLQRSTAADGASCEGADVPPAPGPTTWLETSKTYLPELFRYTMVELNVLAANQER